MENSNISPCQNTIFKKSSKRNQNYSRYYNSLPNLKFQHKPKYHLSKILIQKETRLFTQGPKSLKLLYSIVNLNTISLPTKARPIEGTLICTHTGIGSQEQKRILLFKNFHIWSIHIWLILFPNYCRFATSQNRKQNTDPD